MALKQNSDKPETLRQAVQSFRDAIDAISFPLPSGLERMLQMEGVIEDFNVSLPLAGFSLFDGLTSEADIEMCKQSPNIDSQRSKTDEYRADSSQVKRVMQDGRAEDCSRNHSPGNIPGIMDKTRVTPLEPHATAPDTMLEIPAEANNKKVREQLGGGGGKSITPISVSAMESIPGSFTPSPIQNRKQNLDAVENTLVAVDNLAKSILNGEHKSCAELVHAEQENVESGLKHRSKGERLKTESLSAKKTLGAVSEDKAPGHTGRGSHSHKENRQNGSYHGGIEEPLPGASVFSTRPVESRNALGRRRDGCRALSTCLVKVGRMADEILISSAKGSKADGNTVRTQKRYSQSEIPGSAIAGTVLSAGEFDSKPDLKNQQPKGNFLSNKVNNVTEVVSNKSMPADSLDKDAVTALVNDVLVEQARRHGVDLS
jgi:hypothetical protein